MAARAPRKKPAGRTRRSTRDGRGRLRIGDQWNAITIIALSQNSPLKAIAEFVENSIDARARNITIIRGREQGEAFLRVVDDGEGIRLNDAGAPDFDYVATHVCDSIKRRLKAQGATGIQGEFGIGLLSFWTVGERLVLSSAGADGRVHEMEMHKRYRTTRLPSGGCCSRSPAPSCWSSRCCPASASSTRNGSRRFWPASCANGSAPPGCASASRTGAHARTWR